MLTDEYLLPLVLTPVRNPRPPTENEIPVLLIVIRNGPNLNVRLKIHAMMLLEREKQITIVAFTLTVTNNLVASASSILERGQREGIMSQYFHSDDQVRIGELGKEENLSGDSSVQIAF